MSKQPKVNSEPVTRGEQILINMIIGELRMAEEKHPGFCKAMTIASAGTIKEQLFMSRMRKERYGTGDWILAEEIYEAFEAYIEGRFQECLVELAQCGAVIFRMMAMVGGKVAEDGMVAVPPLAPRRFVPPSAAEVKAYADVVGYGSLDAEAFVDFYASKGWKVGDQTMKDWRAAVRTWLRRDGRRDGGRGYAKPTATYLAPRTGDAGDYLPPKV